MRATCGARFRCGPLEWPTLVRERMASSGRTEACSSSRAAREGARVRVDASPYSKVPMKENPGDYFVPGLQYDRPSPGAWDLAALAASAIVSASVSRSWPASGREIAVDAGVWWRQHLHRHRCGRLGVAHAKIAKIFDDAPVEENASFVYELHQQRCIEDFGDRSNVHQGGRRHVDPGLAIGDARTPRRAHARQEKIAALAPGTYRAWRQAASSAPRSSESFNNLSFGCDLVERELTENSRFWAIKSEDEATCDLKATC